MSTKVLTILSIVTLLVFAGLITLQALELKHYSDEPSVWPAAQK